MTCGCGVKEWHNGFETIQLNATGSRNSRGGNSCFEYRTKGSAACILCKREPAFQAHDDTLASMPVFGPHDGIQSSM